MLHGCSGNCHVPHKNVAPGGELHPGFKAKVTIPSSVTCIGPSCFKDCSSLSSVPWQSFRPNLRTCPWKEFIVCFFLFFFKYYFYLFLYIFILCLFICFNVFFLFFQFMYYINIILLFSIKIVFTWFSIINHIIQKDSKKHELNIATGLHPQLGVGHRWLGLRRLHLLAALDVTLGDSDPSPGIRWLQRGDPCAPGKCELHRGRMTNETLCKICLHKRSIKIMNPWKKIKMVSSESIAKTIFCGARILQLVSYLRIKCFFFFLDVFFFIWKQSAYTTAIIHNYTPALSIRHWRCSSEKPKDEQQTVTANSGHHCCEELLLIAIRWSPLSFHTPCRGLTAMPFEAATLWSLACCSVWKRK